MNGATVELKTWYHSPVCDLIQYLPESEYKILTR